MQNSEETHMCLNLVENGQTLKTSILSKISAIKTGRKDHVQFPLPTNIFLTKKYLYTYIYI